MAEQRLDQRRGDRHRQHQRRGGGIAVAAGMDQERQQRRHRALGDVHAPVTHASTVIPRRSTATAPGLAFM